MKDKISKNHLLTRFILLFNIIFITITVIFFILFNNTILSIQIPSYLRDILKKMNILVFFFSFIIIFLNAYLLIHHLFYNIKQYFKLTEKLDFNDLSGTLGILNNLPSMDEYGDLGKRVTRILRVYLNYANLLRKRLAYQDKKMKVLIEEAQIPLLIFDRNIDNKTYNLSFVSKTARTFLGLDNASSIIGKSSNILYSKSTLAKLNNFVNQNIKDSITTQMFFPTTIEWIKPSDKEGIKESSSIFLDVSIIPFAFQFPDDYQYQDPKSNLSNFNIIIDYYFVLIHKVKSLETSNGLHPDLEEKLHSILDI